MGLNMRRVVLAALLIVAFPLSFGQTTPSAPSTVPLLTHDRLPMQQQTEPYRLYPGDTIDVNFRFTPEFNDEVAVGPDGRVTLKSTGEILLAGLTLDEARRKIAHESESKLANPEVAVLLKEFERPHIIVAGEVLTPGRFELRRPITALQAILMAGGPKEDGALGRVLLFRKLNSEVSEVHVLQLGDFRSKNRSKSDMILQPDDMLLVRHDNLSKVERFVKAANLGLYFDPIATLVK